MTNDLFGQTKVSNQSIGDKTLQKIFDQISLPNNTTISEGFQGVLSDCEILIELNQYLNSESKFLIDGKQACPVEKAIIFQLNQDFFRIESLKRTDSKLVARVVWFDNRYTVLQEWVIEQNMD